MKKLVIFGAGDAARVASVYFGNDSPYDVTAFTVNEAYLRETELLGKPVIPFEQAIDVYPPDKYDMFIGIGYKRVNRARAEVYERCKSYGYELASFVSSHVLSCGDLDVGDNCFILEQNVIQPFVKIGNDVTLWSGNHIGHDTEIGDHCFIASHAVISGNVRIGPYCFIGVNATLRDGINVAPECVIGAGAIILSDTREQQVFAAKATEPARILSHQLRSFR